LSSGIITLDEAILRFGRAQRNQLTRASDLTRGSDNDKRKGPAAEYRVVFTNGCFDLLHPGHIRTLEAARRLGDALIVGLNSDRGVRELKGAGRPILPERERAEILAALECVNAVVIFDEPTPREIIAALLPDVLVKGGDWAGDRIVGREEVEAAGGCVVSTPVAPGFSTSSILRKIRDAGSAVARNADAARAES
jgi:D-glycero-beta-D-manno-heptose 1-phosphate adenylyltransferase